MVGLRGAGCIKGAGRGVSPRATHTFPSLPAEVLTSAWWQRRLKSETGLWGEGRSSLLGDGVGHVSNELPSAPAVGRPCPPLHLTGALGPYLQALLSLAFPRCGQHAHSPLPLPSLTGSRRSLDLQWPLEWRCIRESPVSAFRCRGSQGPGAIGSLSAEREHERGEGPFGAQLWPWLWLMRGRPMSSAAMGLLLPFSVFLDFLLAVPSVCILPRTGTSWRGHISSHLYLSYGAWGLKQSFKTGRSTELAALGMRMSLVSWTHDGVDHTGGGESDHVD